MKARAITKRARAARWLMLVTAAMVAAPSAASAQGAPPSAQGAPLSAEASQASRDADAAFARGKELYRLGKLDAAYEAYRTAWSLKQSYDIAANLANAELQRGMKIEAAEHLAYCLRTFPATGNPAQHERVRAQFRAVRQQVGAIVVKAGLEGAEVLFNGEPVGRTPFRHEVFVQPGTVVVEGRFPGHEPARVTLEIPAGETRTADLVLLPPPERPAPAAQQAPAALPPRVEVPAPAPSEWDTGGPRRALLIGGAATAGAAAIAGVVFTAVAVTKGSDAEELRDSVVRDHGAAACSRANAPAAACADVKGAFDVHRRWTNAAFWSFVGAGVVGAGTLIYGLTTTPSKQAGLVRVVPLVGANSVGVSLGGVL